MTETRLTRPRLTEPCVHIPCGGIRGPIGAIAHWQSCSCEPEPRKWPGCDVSREKDLCIICFRATAGGVSKWSWRACADCRTINDAVGVESGARPFALGRHSIMNGIGVRGGQSPEVTRAAIEHLLDFAQGGGRSRLTAWREQEYPRLAAAFDPDADVPLRLWQQQWPPGADASLDAFRRLLGNPQQ